MIALSVAAALLLTGVLVGRPSHRRLEVRRWQGGCGVGAGLRRPARRAAGGAQFAASFFTYDYRNINVYFRRIEAASTGSFRSDFVSKEATLKTVLASLKTVATGQVPDNGAGIFALADGKAVAFVAANMNASNAVTKNGQQRYRVKLSLEKVKGAWLVSDFQEVL